MSDSKHTPGPWCVFPDPSHFWTNSTVLGGASDTMRGIDHQMIVEVGGWANVNEQEANARLIAAAPELLEALERVCSWLDVIATLAPELGGCLVAIDNARAAIAKATGESDD